MPPDSELTRVSAGQPFMEFLPIMINKVGVLIALEVISGMPELSCNPLPLRLSLLFLYLNALFCVALLILCTAQRLLMNSPLLIDMDNKDCFVPLFSYQCSLTHRDIESNIEVSIVAP